MFPLLPPHAELRL